jgi:F0F1-type ATP synthase epsilon subunit
VPTFPASTLQLDTFNTMSENDMELNTVEDGVAEAQVASASVPAETNVEGEEDDEDQIDLAHIQSFAE